MNDSILFFLNRKATPLTLAGDRLVLVLHHRGEVELGRGDDDAERAEAMRRLLEHFGSVEQRLRGNAADVEAGAAERLFLLDDGDLHAELGGADGADVTAGSRPDDDEIVSSRQSSPCRHKLAKPAAV